MVRSTAKSTYFKELLFPFFKIFYTLIVHYVINFVFSIGKQPYRDLINFVSYIHVVYSNNINFTYLYMRTNYLSHLANIWYGNSLFDTTYKYTHLNILHN